MRSHLYVILLFFILSFNLSCNDDNDNSIDYLDDSTTQISESIYERIYGASSEISFDDNWV